jgi:DNA-directed RNA polymerase specialized sigma24 family protein
LAEGLPEKQQIVFILRTFEEIEAPEVCEILNMSENSRKVIYTMPGGDQEKASES